MSKEVELDQNILQPPVLENDMVKKGQHTAIKELYEVGTPKKAIPQFCYDKSSEIFELDRVPLESTSPL